VLRDHLHRRGRPFNLEFRVQVSVIGPVSALDIGNRIAEEADGSFMAQLVAVILATALSSVRPPACSEKLRPFYSGTPASIACAGLMSRTNMAMVQRLM
jgi:hypothetical protein